MNERRAPFHTIMERRLLMKKGGSDFEEIVIRVGMPEDWGHRDWHVPVDLTPWRMAEPTRITGHDALHAMQLALEFIERALQSDGSRQFFFRPEGSEPPEPYEPTL
jgi:hypothetical protein